MNLVLMLGSLLFVFGLLIFSIKLSAYNRRKYMDETIQSTAIDNAPGYVQMFPRFIAIAILIIAVVVLFIFHE